jgi:hypothetical protein
VTRGQEPSATSAARSETGPASPDTPSRSIAATNRSVAHR